MRWTVDGDFMMPFQRRSMAARHDMMTYRSRTSNATVEVTHGLLAHRPRRHRCVHDRAGAGSARRRARVGARRTPVAVADGRLLPTRADVQLLLPGRRRRDPGR